MYIFYKNKKRISFTIIFAVFLISTFNSIFSLATNPSTKSFKFAHVPLELSKEAISALGKNNKKGLIIGRGSFERVNREKLIENLKTKEFQLAIKKSRGFSTLNKFIENKNNQYLSSKIDELQKEIVVLKKLSSAECWFYLDPDNKCQTVSDNLNVVLLATWPLDKPVLNQLKEKFDVVVMDHGVFQHVYQDQQLKIDYLAGKKVPDNFNLQEANEKLLLKSTQLLQDVFSITNMNSIVCFSGEILTALSSYVPLENNKENIGLFLEYIRKARRIVKENGWIHLYTGEVNHIDEIYLPHYETTEEIGEKFSLPFSWHAIIKQ